MQEISPFWGRNSKNFLGRGLGPLPRPHPRWEWTPPLHILPRPGCTYADSCFPQSILRKKWKMCFTVSVFFSVDLGTSQYLYIVISLSKICDRDWSYMRHVICTNNHCWPCSGAAVNSTGQHYRSALPVNITSRTEDVIPCFRGWFLVRTLY